MVCRTTEETENHKFEVGVAPDRGLVWQVMGNEEYILPSELADRILRLFLDLMSKQIRGRWNGPACEVRENRPAMMRCCGHQATDEAGVRGLPRIEYEG